MAFDWVVLHGIVGVSIEKLGGSSGKWYISFLEKVLVFHKICFKVKVLKTLRNSSDTKTCWQKHAHFLNGVLFKKSVASVFRGT